MAGKHEDRVQIDASGAARPTGAVAEQRLRAREGEYEILPAPAHLVFMRSTSGDPATRPRCRLSGEIVGPGGLCEIALFVGQSGWTGELVAVDGISARSLFFQDGGIISAESSVERERLGGVLYRHGALDETQVEQASALMEKEGLRFGEAAVKLGFLQYERLFLLMGKQIETILDGALSLDHGMFYFLDTFDETRLSFRRTLPVDSVVIDAARRIKDMAYYRERIPSEDHIPERIAGRRPPPGLAAVWGAIDGIRTVAEVGRALQQGELEVTKSLVELVQTGVVTIHAPRLTDVKTIVEVFNRALTVILRELDALDEGDEVRAQLASFARNAKVYEAVFRGAGPAEDGSLDAPRVAANLARLPGSHEAHRKLGGWLHEYATFAMFLARPHLRRAETPPEPRTPGKPPKMHLSQKIAAVLAPLAPDKHGPGRRES